LSTEEKYPLLSELLALRKQPIEPFYSVRDVAGLFGVTVRAIQSRVSSGQLTKRDLPGRAKFLPADLEEFLQKSKRGGRK
jgi:hypothetical protein